MPSTRSLRTRAAIWKSTARIRAPGPTVASPGVNCAEQRETERALSAQTTRLHAHGVDGHHHGHRHPGGDRHTHVPYVHHESQPFGREDRADQLCATAR